MAQQGPVPTKLVALSDICSLAVGEKVRFLGCVIKYNTASAFLTLQHNYPLGSRHKVLVDVNLLVETLSSTVTRVGEWINVMGYVTTLPIEDIAKSTSAEDKVSYVQAIVLWSAGSINLTEYERSLADQLAGRSAAKA